MGSYEEISPAEAEPRLAEFHAVDVRAQHEFHGPLGRVSGSILVPLPELEARAGELPTDRPLLLICRSGNRSGKACDLLHAKGLGPAVNLAGGMIAWNEAGLPLERSEPESLTELLDSVAAWLAQVSSLTREATLEVLRERFECLGASLEEPTTSTVGQVLDFVEESLSQHSGLPDLDLSMSAFRRSLAVL